MKAGRIIFVLVFAFAMVSAVLGGYVTAYVQLGTYHDWQAFIDEGPTNRVTRHYENKKWCVTLFTPAAAAESKWIGCPVHLTYREEPIVIYDTNDMP